MEMERLLIYAPGVIKDILFSLWGLKARYERFGIYYKKYVDFLRKSQYWNKDKLLSYQKERLRRLFSEAFQCSQYYHDVFINKGIRYKDIKNGDPFEILKIMPFLEKEFLKNNIKIIQNKCRKSYMSSSTSGTTGTPLVVHYDKESWQVGFAFNRRIYDWAGLPERFKTVRFSGHIFLSPLDLKLNKYWTYDFFNKKLFMSTYHMNNKTFPYYVKKINSFKPDLIEGYPSAIYFLATYILKSGDNLNFQPKAVITTAETLYEFQRQVIENVFRAKVFNQYASSEGAPIIFECKYGNLHIFLESGIFEFFDIRSNGANRELYNSKNPLKYAAITSFINWKVPLIRYRIGDIFELDNIYELKKCKCGKEFPFVKSIIGRQDDIVYTPYRGYMGMVSYRIFKKLNSYNIKKAQIIQKSPTFFQFLLVVEENFDENDRKKIIKRAKEVLGDVKISIKIVNDIPLYKSGKYRSVVREFDVDF